MRSAALKANNFSSMQLTRNSSFIESNVALNGMDSNSSLVGMLWNGLSRTQA